MMLTQLVEESTIIGNTNSNNFDIGDPTMIIDFMSKHIYSNPIKIVMQEYISNARDAHIEVGKANVPVKVKLPNKYDPTLKIQDFGLGIHPDRMKNVFCRYGVSTKRGENNSSGGWGIGAKSFWAYGDTFEIRTTANENGKLVCRTYSAIKEQGKAPRLIEFGDGVVIDMNDSTLSDEEKQTGTTISGNIKSEDFDKFRDYAIQVTQFWNVRPVIEGCNPLPEYRNFEWAYEQPTWKIGANDSYYTESFICIDGIPYPLNTTAIREMAISVDVYSFIRKPVVLFFGVGELSVSLNREQLHYDEQTIKTIVSRFLEIKKWIADNAQAQIEKASSFNGATIAFNNLNAIFNHGIAGNVFWNKILVSGKDIRIVDGYCRVYRFEYGQIGDKIKSKRAYSIPYGEQAIIVENDEDKVTLGKIYNLLESNPNKQIYVFKPENVSKWQSEIAEYDIFERLYMSKLAKKVLPKTVRGTGTGNRSQKYTIKDVICIDSDGNKRVEDINYMEDSGYYVVQSSYHKDNLSDSYFSNTSTLVEFLNKFAPGEEVYIVPNKHVYKLEKNDKFINFNIYAKELISLEIQDEKFVEKINEVKISNILNRYTFENDVGGTVGAYMANIIPELDDSNIIKQWFNESKKVNTSKLDDNHEILLSYAKKMCLINNSYVDDELIKDHPVVSLYKKGNVIIEVARSVLGNFGYTNSYETSNITEIRKQLAIHFFKNLVDKV